MKFDELISRTLLEFSKIVIRDFNEKIELQKLKAIINSDDLKEK